ncbi:DNA adenine methylase [Herbaspirillum sp. NPDC087042]|uniref:DNA adenine methylase n=1 Tax=Herbaspirillum sp. NPDC087042 TaxID=3364004 RepID=UPI003808BBC7
MWRENWAVASPKYEVDVSDFEDDLGQKGRNRCISFFDSVSEKSHAYLNVFPTTRFYGSKRRQLQWLHSELQNIGPLGTALDAFGGTGTVTHLLRGLGWNVTYNDIFDFNLISARALFSRRITPIEVKELQDLLDSVIPFDGFITQTFDELFFTREENRWLDGFMRAISSGHELNADVWMFCLFQACLMKRPFNLFHRANLHLRHSTMPVDFGNRATWSKSFEHHMLNVFGEWKRFFSNREQATTIATGCNAINVSGEFDLVYLDPPYFKKGRATETYVDRYHFLEGLSRFSEWPSLIDPSSPIRSIAKPYREEWTTKADVISNVEKLFAQHPNSKFALSYVAGEQPSEESLFELFKSRFDKVRLSRRSFSRALSKKEFFEILIIGK